MSEFLTQVEYLHSELPLVMRSQTVDSFTPGWNVYDSSKGIESGENLETLVAIGMDFIGIAWKPQYEWRGGMRSDIPGKYQLDLNASKLFVQDFKAYVAELGIAIEHEDALKILEASLEEVESQYGFKEETTGDNNEQSE